MDLKERAVKKYYEAIESRLCYRFLLNRSQHFGYYPDVDTTIGESQAQRMHHDLLAALLDLPAGSLVLDAGCGQGVASADLASRYGLRVIGIDIVPYILKIARRRRNASCKLAMHLAGTSTFPIQPRRSNIIKWPERDYWDTLSIPR